MEALRASAEAAGTEIDLGVVMPDSEGDGGVPNGEALIEFVEAVLGNDRARREAARRRLRDELGDAATVDSAAVIANYSALDRVADATGIPLEAAKETNTADFRTALGIDAFARKNAPPDR